jgi:hypothetical protein
VRARTEPPSVNPDASEDTDELADRSPARGARMPNAGGARERPRMRDADGAGESARLAADALLPTRGRVIAAYRDPLLPATCE